MGTIHKFERPKPVKGHKPGPWDQAAARKPAAPKEPMFRRGGSGREPFINSWRGLVLCLALMVGMSLATGFLTGGISHILSLFH